jgi:polyphosphate glucokinase
MSSSWSIPHPNVSTSKKTVANSKSKAPAPQEAKILCFDIGGTGIKAMLMQTDGTPASDRQRVPTPSPAAPDGIMQSIKELAARFSDYQYVACGFPGVIKQGFVYTAANLDPEWIGFDLQSGLERLLGVPAGVANDAAVQGMAAVSGSGVELCLTFGTGMGSSLFVGGALVPGLELGHHPFRKGKTYEDYLGLRGLEKYGKKKWNKRLQEALGIIEHLFNYDRLYIGGGNNRLIRFELPKNATLVENLDGLKGGAALWRDVIQTEHTLARQTGMVKEAAAAKNSQVNL